jgi:hypothetical protein
MMDESAANALLKDEYFFLQKVYEDFDNKSLQIKGWIASGSVAGFIFSREAGNYSQRLIVLIIVACLAIWGIETLWKLRQRGFADRIRVIEGHFRGDTDLLEPVLPLQIYGRWYRSYFHDEPIYAYESAQKLRSRSLLYRSVAMALRPGVFLPYAAIIVVAVWALKS